ncbi:sugar transferase [bacterium]|nr:sugar transferase [bacterium]
MGNKNIQAIELPFLKRVFDILFTLVMLFLIWPLIVFILLIIFFDHVVRGLPFAPFFYIEKRISKGKPFSFVKFNIFKPGVVERIRRKGKLVYTKELEHDNESVTPVGHIVQQLYLDELPQLISVLKGDISFVGPRPVNLGVYKKDVDRGHVNKTIIKAGLTGSYQSLKGITDKTVVELEMNYIDYCRNNPGWKVVLNDIKIIFQTLRILFRAEGL